MQQYLFAQVCKPCSAFGGLWVIVQPSDPQFVSNILAFTEGKVEGGSYFHCREEGLYWHYVTLSNPSGT